MSNMSNTEMTNWRDLIVTDSDGATGETLGSIVDNAPANLDSAEISGGRIASWDGFMLSAPGEDADWDTPRGEVNWDGFQDAVYQQSSYPDA